MPFDTIAITGILRELYGPGIEEILYPENNAGPLHRLPRTDQWNGANYIIPLIYGIEEAVGITTLNRGSYGFMKAERDSSTLVVPDRAIFEPIMFDEEWVDA